MNKQNLPLLILGGLACSLITIAIIVAIATTHTPSAALLIGLLLSVSVGAGLWMMRRLLRWAREVQSINLRLRADLAAREDDVQQLQQLHSQCLQRVEQRTAEVRRLGLAIEQTPASVVLTGRNSGIEYVNPSFETNTGYTAAEVIGKNPRILQSGVHTAEYYAEMWQTLSSGQVWRGEMCNRRKNGKLYWEDTSIAPVMDNDGKITNYVAVKIDITERKLAEKEKHETEQQFRSLVFNVPAVVYRLSCDADHTIQFISDAVEALCGYPASDFIHNSARSFVSVIHPDDVQAVTAGMRRATRAKEAFELRFRIRHRDGSVREVVERGRAIYDDDGKPLFLDGVMTDITEQAAREQALAESEARCRALFESTSDAIMILDETGFRDCNQAALELFAIADQQTFCQYHAADLSPETQPCGTASRHLAQQHLETAMREGRCHFEWVHQRPDGERFEADVLYSAVTLDGHKLIECSVRDITVRKKAQASLQEAKAAAEEATRAKSQFLASMSHELRTPLNGVIGMMELLAGTELTEQQRQLTDACRNSGESLLHLINDILDFSKIEAGKLELELHDFDLEQLVTDTVETLFWRAADKGLEMPCYVDQMSHLIVQGDSNRLRQVLVNLLGNAIKFTPDGEVSLRTQIVTRTEDQISVRFSIADTGIGIPADKLPHLFQSFSQVDASTTRNYGGTGLGLTISQSLVDLMGGSIEVESKVGAGSRFWFEVSLLVVSEAGEAALTPSPLTNRRILIVDNNPTNTAILCQYAADWGLSVVTADSVDAAQTALERAAVDGTPFDLVLCDYQLPPGDGLQLAAALNPHPAQVVLVLGATDLQRNAQQLREHGVAATLRKPLRRGELHDVLCGLFAEAPSPQPTATDAPSTSQDVPVPTAHILLAEDNSINQMYMIELLKQLGVSCDTAGTGREACDAIQQHRYDLVLMDCQMPEMDGFEATRRIRQWETEGLLSGHLPIIALTAFAVKGDRQRCLDAGMDEYLSKPVQRAQIVDMFARFLGEETNSSTAPIDLQSLLERCFHNIDFAFTLLDELQTTGADRVQTIRQHAERCDAPETASAAHSLKGAAGILCAEAVQKLAAEVEQAGRQQTMENVGPVVDQLDTEMRRCLQFLPQLRSELQTMKAGA